jgi:hypothetical protein
MNRPIGYDESKNYEELYLKALSLIREGKTKEGQKLLTDNGGIIMVTLCRSYQNKRNEDTGSAMCSECREVISYPKGMD